MFVTHAFFKHSKDDMWIKCIMIGRNVDEVSTIIYADEHGNPLVYDRTPWDYKTVHYEGCANFNV